MKLPIVPAVLNLCGVLIICVVMGGCTTHSNSPAPTTVGSSAQTDAGSHTLRQMLWSEPSSIDPATVPDVIATALVMHTFEGLTRFNEKNEIEPCLAEKWDISKDGKTYTFHLRKGVTFHNGRLFEAADVKYSWERALNPHTASSQAADYMDGILGVPDVAAGKRKDLPGVTVIDSNTLQVVLDRPRAYFTGMLAMPQDFVVCKEAVEKSDGKVTVQSYVGTGPFKFESYQPGQQFILTAYNAYWGGSPLCPRIEMPVILDKQTAYDNFLTNRIDVYSDMPAQRYAQDRDANKLQAEYHVSPQAAFAYLGLQEARQPLFQNRAIRRAFALAIDRDEIIRVAFKRVGEVATGILPKSMPLSGPTPPQIVYDPGKARDLLASAGYPGGKGFPSITLSYIQKDPDRESEALIIRRNLHDNLGIEVETSPREAGEFWKAEEKHGMEMYIGGWVADYLDPQDFLSTLYVSGRPMNFVDYKNPKFDALCADADSNLDNNKRAALYGQAHALLIDDMPVVPLVFEPRISLVHTYIKGWRDNMLYLLPNSHTSKN